MPHGSTGTVSSCEALLLVAAANTGSFAFPPFESLTRRALSRNRSAGHACLLQYIYLHLAGYKSWTLDMLKRYHSPDFVHSQEIGRAHV